MTLNKQLLCVSLLLLSLPWAGCQYLKEMDSSLRQGQEATLQATTRVIATALAQNPNTLLPHEDTNQASSFSPSNTALYCHPLNSPVRVDGYDEEWGAVLWTDYSSLDGTHHLRYRCGVINNELALLFSVNDTQVIYNNPTRSLASNGDRLILSTSNGRKYIFTAIAPGKITTRYFNQAGKTYRESKIDAAWVEQENGYQLEIKMPLSLTGGQMGFSVIDESDHGITAYGLFSEQAPPLFIYQAPAIKQAIAAFSQPGLRLRLTDAQGWLIASSGSLLIQSPDQSHWLLRKLYRSLLAPDTQQQTLYPDGVNFYTRNEVSNALLGNSSSQWYRDPSSSNHQVLSTAVPVFDQGHIIATLISEQSSEQTAALTDQAFSRLFLLSLAVIGVTVLGLLAYASVLSWRIRRLSSATQQALDDHGNLPLHFPNSRAKDEIGTLTRNYAELMKRIHEYTEYLQTLSRKLSHELRTPLAIIHSSLDNLANQSLDEQSKIYQQRAKDGAMRLGNILTAMSEARRVEESIEHAEPELINIAQLLQDVTCAYQDLYQQHHITLSGIDVSTLKQQKNNLLAVPDLLVQMLDKLIDNAVSFCPNNGNIEITYTATPGDIVIAVSNEGPLLPDAMQNQLFDNMVSLREKEQDETHLGLGLHIVHLIVEYHQGRVNASNLSDQSGVCFTVSLPCK